MLRVLHRWPGLVAALLISLIALSGAALSVFPALEVAGSPPPVASQNVADLVARIDANFTGVEQIKRAPSGRITAYFTKDDRPQAAVIDPATGMAAGSVDPAPLLVWLTNLHRSLFLDDTGRIVTGLGAAALMVLAISGVFLLARRVGGWSRLFARLQGPFAGRLHVEIARLVVAGLVLSAFTALWMTALNFELLPEGATTPPFPQQVSGQIGADPGKMTVLANTQVSDLRALTFPYQGDASDVFTLTTENGEGYIDQGTGQILAWQGQDFWAWANEIIYMLHTGQGASVLGLLLGLMALGLPVMAVTGTLVWARARLGRPKLRGNASAGQAETIILVGSEGGSTWGFAATLHAALTGAGQKVHTVAMQAFAPRRYAHAKRIIVLTATYGDGDAPASAKGFIQMLQAAGLPHLPLAVLGFGDRQFGAYCGYALAVEAAARAAGWPELIGYDSVDRQSPQDFARWGRALGAALGFDLVLNHHTLPPKTESLTLMSRSDYGAEVQAPTAILRFALPRAGLLARLTGRGFPRYEAGDLLGIVPRGDSLPRYYSLASGSSDGFVEICVRKLPGGLCSGQLTDLAVGETVTAFLRANPGFHPARGKGPMILIGAGTGIGPLAGFIRANRTARPMHLFFGARDPQSDLLYGKDLESWLTQNRLTRLTTAFSRQGQRMHVQDALRRDAARVADLVADGAHVMVCGGRDMAAGVKQALADILAPSGLTPAMLKAQGRYAEDVY